MNGTAPATPIQISKRNHGIGTFELMEGICLEARQTSIRSVGLRPEAIKASNQPELLDPRVRSYKELEFDSTLELTNQLKLKLVMRLI